MYVLYGVRLLLYNKISSKPRELQLVFSAFAVFMFYYDKLVKKFSDVRIK